MKLPPESLPTVVLDHDLLILRGLPGSGKSTLAAHLASAHGYLHLETDQHFIVNGAYRFDPSRVADAHAVVARDALAALQTGRRVVIANTHVRLWEMAALVGVARLASRSFAIVECVADWGNIHGVPVAALEGMRVRWEALPAEFDLISFRFPA